VSGEIVYLVLKNARRGNKAVQVAHALGKPAGFGMTSLNKEKASLNPEMTTLNNELTGLNK